MQGRVAGFFMTLLMALPLAAIPLMSIFGIPQLGSLAAPLEETGFLLEDPVSANGQSSDSWNLDSAPVFGANNNQAGNAPAAGDTAAIATTSGQDLDAAFANNTPGVLTQGNRGNLTGSQPPAVTVGNMSWEQAMQKLAQYGITDYRLQPGTNAQGFHFACYSRPASPGSRPTVIRFEAEAADPLQAVQQTLQQVEQWHGDARVHQKAISLF